MAQLEVPPGGPCRGHDLRPLDADPKEGTRRGLVDGDRGLARGRPHGCRRALRRRRGRGQRIAQGSGKGAGTCRGADRRHRRGAGCAPEQAPPPSGSRGRQGRNGAQSPGTGRNGSRHIRAGARTRCGRAPTPPAPAVARLNASPKWRRCGERCTGGSATSAACSRCQRGRCPGACRGELGKPPDTRDPASPPALDLRTSLRPGLPAPPGTRSRGGSAGSAWTRRW